MNRPSITKLVIVAILTVLIASGVGSVLSSSRQQAAAYSSDPIAVGNWTYDQFDSIIVQEAQNYGINPFYIKAQIMLESDFNQWAQSSVINWSCGGTHDLGLMQVNPYCSGVSNPSSLYDPTTNIQIGTSELASAYRALGDMNLALQAYNIGTTAVENGARNWAYSDQVDAYYSQFVSEHNSLYGSSPPPPPQTNSGGSTTYTVQPGDYLSLIASKFGTTYTAIAQANGISSPYLIYPGEHLTIPGASSSGSGSWTYTVQAGDSLYSIGQRYGYSSMTLAQYNGISSPYTIYPGERITIP